MPSPIFRIAALPAPARWLCLAALLALAPLSARGQAASPAASAGSEAVSVAASGLVSPRGFTFGPDGGITVAIAGTSGPNAAVAVVEDGCPRVIADGLPAYPVVFGGLVGVADVAYLDGTLYALLAGGNIDGGGMPNGLYRIEDGDAALVADVSAFIRDNPVDERPFDYDTDGQPYALLPVDGGFLATEGNSNQLLRLGLDGSVARVADLSRGHPIPTGIAPAPAGGAYVAYFTAAPYEDGAAKVVRVGADGGVEDAWTGLTVPTSLAVGPDGALYAAEMATGIDPDDPSTIRAGTGRIVRQTGPDSAEVVATGLDLPIWIEFAPDGALHVAGPTFGADAEGGRGTILRLDPTTAEPIDLSSPPAAPECADVPTA